MKANNSYSRNINNLIDALQSLPGVGFKSAQRMAFYLLEHDRDAAIILQDSLCQALSKVFKCKNCRNLTEQTLCHICVDTNRDNTLLCIVETPSDIAAIENIGVYKGLYFVLMGKLSPLDGIGPEELGLDLFEKTINSKKDNLKEIVLATNLTVEGEATAHYIVNILNNIKDTNIKISRIAHGVPFGGELEYLDSNTLAQAFISRNTVN